ncbi:CbtB-domain containing protein [Rhizobiales bacterium]|nr:CbtB domain-containing protein [Hongsoonwoonella zoysiae]NRG16635.1 CbtB-domain containing protein [Hongsoonwoonella zoysiae]
MNDIKAIPSINAIPADRVTVAKAAMLALVFGMGIVFAVGFASPNVLHNAAHDSRHSLGFPCH